MSTTALITGASSGIGLGFARAFLDRGATVISAARRTCPIPEAISLQLDIDHSESIQQVAAEVESRFPDLNLVIHNAGIQRELNFLNSPHPAAAIEAEIRTNLTGAILVANAFLPQLLRQPKSRLVIVSSALAFIPLAETPVYCATKAALHSFTLSLRHQLRQSSVQVTELIPPLVETHLHDGQRRRPQGAMHLDEFIAQSMRALDSGRQELPIARANILRLASRLIPGTFFNILNNPSR